MPRQQSGQENVRKLGKTGSSENPSYYLTLPIEFIRKLGWRDGQKLIVKYEDGKPELVIEDFKK